MTQSGSPPCPRPPSLLPLPLCHRARFFFLLWQPLLFLRSLLWSRPTRTVYHRFHRRKRRTTADDSFSNVFGSSMLKLLLTVCLILVLPDPPVHRLLCRPTLHLQDVFSPGPRLRRPPLSSALRLPWMAPANLPTGSAAPWTAILRPVSVPPLLPLDLASLRGAVASPARSSAYSIPRRFCWRTLGPTTRCSSSSWTGPSSFTTLPSCRPAVLPGSWPSLLSTQITSHT
jgi:hypothetical protein